MLKEKDKEIESIRYIKNNFDYVVQKEIEKKDKMIDEMTTYIATLDIEEDICEKTKNEHCDKMNFGECEDCIKQIIERKVTDTNVGERKVENGN